MGQGVNMTYQKDMQIPVTIASCWIETTVPRSSAGEISELYLGLVSGVDLKGKAYYNGTAAERLPTAHPMKNLPTNCSKYEPVGRHLQAAYHPRRVLGSCSQSCPEKTNYGSNKQSPSTGDYVADIALLQSQTEI
jgi:hypothetical protein